MQIDKLRYNKQKTFVLFIAGIICLSFVSREITREDDPEKTGYINEILNSDNPKLKQFLTDGSGKYLDTKNISGDDIIKTARKFIGTPHCFGGSSKKCTDCSGLIMAVFTEHDVNLPHGSEEQARYGKIIREKTQLQKGDLVFFINSYQTTKYITHVGIYLGESQMIHTSSRKGVVISTLENSYWKDKFIFGTRVIP